MATQLDATVVQVIIDYSFRNTEHLMQALTAAGAEEDNHDGNRRLAHLGSTLLRFILSLLVFETAPSRSGITKLETSIISVAQRASVAEQSGIDNFIKYSEKPGARSPRVLALAIDAIIGAVYVDSADFNASWKVALKLKLVSTTCLGNSAFLARPLSGLHKLPSSFARSNTPEDMANFLRPVFSIGTPYDPDMRPSIGLDGTIGAVTSARIPSPMNQLSYYELPISDDTQLWTSIQRSSSRDYLHTEYTGDAISRESAFDVRGIPHARNDLFLATGDSEENRVNFFDQKSNRAQVSQGEPTRGQGGQALLDDDWLNSFLDEENKRCRTHQYPLPLETFLAPRIQTALVDIDARPRVLAKFLIHVASAETLVTLRNVVLSYRERPLSASLGMRPSLSVKERFNIIGLLDTEIAWRRLLRMYHILELYKACRGAGCAEKIIVTTPTSFPTRKRKAGNPLHAAEAEIAERMMKSIYPDAIQGTKDYEGQKATLKRVRKLGQRLHILVTKFGNGILALMLNDDMKGLQISEQM
ncbi:hypothetical protein N7539_008486 [Penicillium diatomitis]|uniref:RNase III domain-containing protein n=1 Tax=Penicillium diatomitis TaxID=2819901 RepID=A0A9W9WRH2_9EURO|nr:uncharacterized protein N7539_008486 [Penicillium diatomitis]KAJ5471917.1 hypothetical protein N7539_008486 [Penicillium diatomitis]